MKKTFLALTALFVLAASAAFANEGKDCKKCAGDKAAECCCKAKDAKSCEKDKAACPAECKDAKPAPAPSTEKKR